MADDLKAALLQRGHRVREYCAIGELLPGMAYLVRRLLENTSNEGFLRIKNTGEASLEQLLCNPVDLIASAPEPMARKPRESAFVNAANLDFALAGNRERQRSALQAFESGRLGRKYPIVIDGRKISRPALSALRQPGATRPGRGLLGQGNGCGCRGGRGGERGLLPALACDSGRRACRNA